MRSKARVFAILVLCIAAMVLTAPMAVAGPVYDISTGTADWQFKSTTSADPSTTGVTAAVITTPNSAWVAIAGADWIAPGTGYDTTGYTGNYTYELTLTPAVAGTYILSGSFASDNLVSSLLLNGTELLAAPQTDIYSFSYTTTFGGAATNPIVLTATVFNESSASPSDPLNPTGFILGGAATLTVVPVPPAAGIGLVMLVGLGISARMRRRYANR